LIYFFIHSTIVNKGFISFFFEVPSYIRLSSTSSVNLCFSPSPSS
jgi:hypothetical protein